MGADVLRVVAVIDQCMELSNDEIEQKLRAEFPESQFEFTHAGSAHEVKMSPSHLIVKFESGGKPGSAMFSMSIPQELRELWREASKDESE